MLKKIFLGLVLGLVVTCAGITKVEAEDIYVGVSPSTGWECYVMDETISRRGSTTYVTLKMYTNNGNVRYLDYKFWYDSRGDVMRFSTDEGLSGIANRYETPIEWEMVQVIRNY
ncbi:MAG: hypothetical protein IKZ58_03105 [Selenomonadaceae bacterium]|nr:hypothetical protein [Selenomonadaceae bacterium]